MTNPGVRPLVRQASDTAMADLVARGLLDTDDASHQEAFKAGYLHGLRHGAILQELGHQVREFLAKQEAKL